MPGNQTVMCRDFSPCPSVRRALRTALLFAVPLLPGWLGAADPPLILSNRVQEQIRAIEDEKATRTPAQRKMESHLVHAAKNKRGKGFPAALGLPVPEVRTSADGRVRVDIDTVVTPDLLARIEAMGGTVENHHARFHAVRARLPMDQIEVLAALPGVRYVKRASEARTNVGSVRSAGDVAHRASEARTSFSVDGTGVKIGVLSDSVDFLANSQAKGELGAVTVLDNTSGSGEGTAMLEIIHDLAPGAALYFATAFNSEADFAQNILNLRAAGCDIIVDDVLYYDEPVFQDGMVAQAVNTVTTNGALYFSSASNSGNKTDGTSGTWEGDFVDGGAASTKTTYGGRLHTFGSTTYNTVASGGSSRRVDLFWSDPWGASTNDYDLYVLNSAGTSLLRYSAGPQTGTENPYESVSSLNVGERIVIVKYSGAARFLHLETGRAVLTTSTAGSTRGHSAASNAFSVAAVSAYGKTSAFTGGSANPVETFSSDGTRRVFYNADGTVITPGNLSSTGGAVRQKPDIAAADGVMTSVTNGGYFAPFYGTSAAAPHAAAIAALLRSYNKQLTPAEIRTALTSTALDIMAAGVDRDSGAGIVMALPALQAVSAANLGMVSATWSDGAGGNGNGQIDPGETIQETLVWTNSGGAVAGVVTGMVRAVTAGVTMIVSNVPCPDAPIHGTTTNPIPFSYRLSKSLSPGTVLVFTNIVASGGRAFASSFSRTVWTNQMVTTFTSTDVPKNIPDPGTCYVTNVVALNGINIIDDVDVGVRINHTYDMDLVFAVQHPDATEVKLAVEQGADGHNFGTGLPPGTVTNTVFDDQAATSVTNGVAPFAGSYRPQELLSTLNGKDASGIWRLHLQDLNTGDAGTDYAFVLRIATHSPQSAIIFNNPPIGSNQTVAAWAATATNLLLRGRDPDEDVIFFRTNSVPLHGTLSGLNTNTGAITYTPLSGYSGTDTFTFVTLDGITNSASATVTVVVARKPQTITFAPIANQIATNLVRLQATASSGLAVTFAVASGPGSIAGATNLTFSATGSVSIAASQAGDGNWAAAPEVTNTFAVSKAVALVTLTNLVQDFVGSPRVVTATTAPTGLVVTVTYNGSLTPPSAVGTYAVEGVVNEPRYQGSASGTLSVIRRNSSTLLILR